MRRWYLLVSVALLVVVGTLVHLFGGPCVPTGSCRSCTVIGAASYRCCVWDYGCWLNPFEPDNQIWCEDVVIYSCPQGRKQVKCQETHRADECGPCCVNAGGPWPIPLPSPALGTIP